MLYQIVSFAILANLYGRLFIVFVWRCGSVTARIDLLNSEYFVYEQSHGAGKYMDTSVYILVHV